MPICCPKNFKYIQPAIRESFKPKAVFERPNVPIEKGTIYKNSYLDHDFDSKFQGRGQLQRPAATFQASDIPMETATTHAMSFLRHDDNLRPPAVVPRDKIRLGTGSISAVTTNRYSYVPKTTKKPQPIRPADSFVSSKAPLASDTTTRLSYPEHSDVSRTKSFKPEAIYKPPDCPVDSDTVHRMSFPPMPVTKREIPPWSVQPIFKIPNVPMDFDTIHKMSFVLPGQFVETADDCVTEDDDPRCVDYYNDAYNKAGL